MTDISSQTQRSTQIDCPICLVPFESTDGQVTLKCTHKCCLPCFLKHADKSNKCPMCRAEHPKIVKQETAADCVAAPQPVVLRPHMPSSVAEIMVRYDMVCSQDYIEALAKGLERKDLAIGEKTKYLEQAIRENCLRSVGRAAKWFENPEFYTGRPFLHNVGYDDARLRAMAIDQLPGGWEILGYGTIDPAA